MRCRRSGTRPARRLLPAGNFEPLLAIDRRPGWNSPQASQKERFVRCFTHFAATHPETSYDNFVRDFGERFVPDYHPPSAVDCVLSAPFEE